MEAVNPATGKTIASYPEHSLAQAAAIADACDAAFASWRRTSFAERARPLRETARLLRERKAGYGRLMSDEMGKLLRDGIAEAEKCAWVC